jgi:hypothetical protein
MELKPTYLDKQLPAAAVTEEMFDDVKAVADAEGVSVSAVIRYALHLFLQGNSDKIRVKSDITSETEHAN